VQSSACIRVIITRDTCSSQYSISLQATVQVEIYSRALCVCDLVCSNAQPHASLVSSDTGRCLVQYSRPKVVTLILMSL
jgi:hypothetical protein